jgi:outer membrane protein OmpA-like peptidoglycan-associated protein
VTVEAPPPPPPPPPAASQLNQIDFKRNSARVDNKAKAILDDVALRLQRDADGKVVIIGGSDAKERRGERLASERAINAKNYLVKEKGIDPSRIELRSGGEGMTAVIWWVPAGAAAPNQGTPVSETAPMPHKAARHAAKKKPQ